MKALLATILVLLIWQTTAQDILKVLENEREVSQFVDLLSIFPDLLDAVNSGAHTLLVPTDAAIAAAKAATPSQFNDTNSIRAFVEYHILQGTHTSASATDNSQLVPTLLTNTQYANVTGGQRVEMVRNTDGHPTFLSAVKAVSTICRPDILFRGGIFHIIDAVLQIPLSFPSTVTKAELQDLITLLDKGGWLNPDSIAYSIAVETPDLTILAPNDPRYGTDYIGWSGLDQTQLDEIFLYHVLPSVLYSPNMTNNTEYTTLANLTLTTRNYDPTNNNNASTLFINQAHLKSTNYLTANGVLHILDQPLNPADISAPSQSSINAVLGIAAQHKPARALTPAAIFGITISIVALILAAILIFFLRRRMLKRRAQQSTSKNPTSHKPKTTTRQVFPPAVSSMTTHRDRPPKYIAAPHHLTSNRAHDKTHNSNGNGNGNSKGSANQDRTKYPTRNASLLGRQVSRSVSLTTARINAALPPRPDSADENQGVVGGGSGTGKGTVYTRSRPPRDSLVELDSKTTSSGGARGGGGVVDWTSEGLDSPTIRTGNERRWGAGNVMEEQGNESSGEIRPAKNEPHYDELGRGNVRAHSRTPSHVGFLVKNRE